LTRGIRFQRNMYATTKYFSPNRYVNYNGIIFPQCVNSDVYSNGGKQSQKLAFCKVINIDAYCTPVFIDLIDNFNQLNSPEKTSNDTLG
jgi:hypothetical protein